MLTGHGHVLVEIAGNTRARIRDIAVAVGLTERTVQAIIADLEAARYLTPPGPPAHRPLRPPVRAPAWDGHRIGPFLELRAVGGAAASWAVPGRASPAAA